MIVGNVIKRDSAAAGAAQIAGPNPRRVGWLIGPPSTGSMNLQIGGDASSSDGVRMSSGIQPLLILFPSPNDWITQPLSIYSSVAQTVNLVEFVDRTP